MRVAFLGRSPPRTAESPRRNEAFASGPHGLGRRGGVFVRHPFLHIPRPPPSIRPTDAAAPLTWIETVRA